MFRIQLYPLFPGGELPAAYNTAFGKLIPTAIAHLCDSSQEIRPRHGHCRATPTSIHTGRAPPDSAMDRAALFCTECTWWPGLGLAPRHVLLGCVRPVIIETILV